ncbi:16S rRNA (guanine(527)-N(7))-methyltransferase RsmG [Thalassiella azotivora]
MSLFRDRLPLAERFAEHLATTGVDWGLLGPRELPRLWTRHVLNCAVLGELLPAGCSVVDVGSGAGLPGLAVAIARPDIRITLVEPLERRTSWLDEVVDDLELATVSVRRARAEEVAGQVTADVVTARAVAPLEKLARWGLPLVAPGGQMLAIKGRSAQEELDASRAALLRLGVDAMDVVTCGAGVLETPTTVVRVRVGADVRRLTAGTAPRTGKRPRRRRPSR